MRFVLYEPGHGMSAPTMIGGFALNTLKKLNGDKFGLPLASIVLANAIGLGATALSK